MIAVSVKQLINGECVEAVSVAEAGGQVVIVKDGRPVCRLAPLTGSPQEKIAFANWQKENSMTVSKFQQPRHAHVK